jgi:hypothetical protein
MDGCVVEEWATLMNIWSCYDAQPLGRASPPPDGNCPDIEAVMKHSDVQRGSEPVYHCTDHRLAQAAPAHRSDF